MYERVYIKKYLKTSIIFDRFDKHFNFYVKVNNKHII